MSSIIIIDDSPEDREWLAEMAREANFDKVLCFEDVEDGLTAFRETPTDLVILDDWLGSKRGWAYAPSFQAISSKASVVIASGVPFPNVEELSEKLDVTFFVKGDIAVTVLRDIMSA